MSMNSLVLSTSWDSAQTNSQNFDQKAVIDGVYIQGATTSSSGLEICSTETPSWNAVPSFTLSWISQEKVLSIDIFLILCMKLMDQRLIQADRNKHSMKIVKVPLYADEERQRLITTLDVPFVKGLADDWYRAGVALSLKN